MAGKAAPDGDPLMSSLSLIVKLFSVVQGALFKLSSALFTVGAADYNLSISVLGGSLYSNGSLVGASGNFSFADLKLGKITFLADSLSVPSFTSRPVLPALRTPLKSNPCSVTRPSIRLRFSAFQDSAAMPRSCLRAVVSPSLAT